VIAVVLSGMRERRLRTALTAIAIVLGVAMVAGTYVQTDQIRSAYGDVIATSRAGVDVEVTAPEAFRSDISQDALLPERLVGRVAAVDGVARAQGALSQRGSLVVGGKAVQPTFAPSLVLSRQDPPFDALQVVTGRQPAGPREVAVDRALAADQDLRLGQRVGIATRTGTQPARLVGTLAFGDVASIGGATLVVATLPEVQRWFGRPRQISQIAVQADAGVTPDELAGRLRAALPRDVTVRTGEQATARDTQEADDAVGSFLTPALLAFSGVAVVVGGFVIFNTFSITVAQRTREFALLRSLGATRAQVLGSVVAEALLLGAAASAVGLAAGIGIAAGLNALFDAAGWGIPHAAPTLAARTIVAALGVGIGVTVVSALAPALRATRVPPVLALQGGRDARRRSPWPRRALGAGALLAGAALVAAGLAGGGTATDRLLLMGAGSLALFVAGAAAAPAVVGPLTGVLGWPLRRFGGVTGELAEENAERDTGRTATTAASLLVGMALVVFVAVLAAGLKASFTQGVEDRLAPTDIVVTSDQIAPIPSALDARLRQVPGVATVSGQRFDRVEVDGAKVNALTDILNGVDPATFARVYVPEWVGEDRPLLASLRPGQALVEEQFAKGHHLAIGDTFTVRAPTGRDTTLTAVGEYRDPQVLQGLIVDDVTFRRVSATLDPFGYFLTLAPGADPDAVLAAAKQAAASYPTATVRTRDGYVDWISGQLDQIVALLYALLAMSVVISVFGIANSMFLAVHERTREIGLLRAIGATASQVRVLVRLESLVVAVLGGLLGCAAGLALAWLTTQALQDWGLVFAVPADQLVLCLLLAAGAGLVAAAAPARRAARLDVLRAIALE
jgi:putative ABC transport system permease protein